jgi:hypothetical protein
MKGFEIALKNKETEITVIISADGTVLKKESAGENKEEAINEKEKKMKMNQPKSVRRKN